MNIKKYTLIKLFLIALFIESVMPLYGGDETVCAKVKINVPQEITVEREGFDASLTLENNLSGYSLKDIAIYLEIKDSDGNIVNDKFYTRIKEMENIKSIGGNGEIGTEEKGTINWLIIPEYGVGGESIGGKRYSVKALGHYTAGGKMFTLETWEDWITVKPQPRFMIEYFLPVRVYGDDPLTEDVIEPMEPFKLGIRVKNTGYGRANNFSVASVQPRIVDNAKRLVFDYWIEQSWVNGSPAEKTLNLNLGNIHPGGSAVGAWEMYCIYTGSFTAFEASYRHSAELGGAATSLIEGVTAYRLIKDVIDDRTQKDDVFDFLVDTDKDMIPDYIFESDGSDEEVMVSEAHFSEDEPSGSEPYAELNLDNTYHGKWFYAAEKDPLGGEVGIVRVERKDGKLINERNWWLDRKGNFHLLDFEGDESYIVFYDVQEMDSTPPVTEILISSPSYYSASRVYVTTGTVFTLRATDEDSKVDSTQYRVNDGTWQEYSPFKVSREGASVIYFRSIDSAGNKEEFKTLKIFVDIEPPESIIEFIGPSYLEKKR